jgi:hypothetical protein
LLSPGRFATPGSLRGRFAKFEWDALSSFWYVVGEIPSCEDAVVISTICSPFCSHIRRLVLLLGLLAVPACGLSDYEKLMDEAQKRGERFRDEKVYLDEPVKIPTRKDKDDKEEPLASAFFRPPKGIQSSGKEDANKLFWNYYRSGSGGEFARVDLAFAADNNTFLEDVERVYPRKQAVTPQWTTPLPFDSWEYDEGPYTYSVNVAREGGTKVAIVFIMAKGRAGNLRKVMELSLQSLAVGPAAVAAQRRYNEKSPWKLESKGSSPHP